MVYTTRRRLVRRIVCASPGKILMSTHAVVIQRVDFVFVILWLIEGFSDSNRRRIPVCDSLIFGSHFERLTVWESKVKSFVN